MLSFLFECVRTTARLCRWCWEVVQSWVQRKECKESHIWFLSYTFDSSSFFLSFPLFILTLFVCSACWEDLKGVARERQDRLQRAEECHCFYQDLTDALTLIQVQYLSICHPSIRTHIYEVSHSVGATEEHSWWHGEGFARSDVTDEETWSSAPRAGNHRATGTNTQRDRRSSVIHSFILGRTEQLKVKDPYSIFYWKM